MRELWDLMCNAWDEEEITTEELKEAALWIFPLPIATLICEEIDVIDLCAM